MEIAGDTALWTRPDTGNCPVSYPAPTYSAVKAIFESVLWGATIEIIPTKVEICTPLQYHTYSNNYGGPLRKASQIKDGNNFQLRTMVLIDVCYRLYAQVKINSNKKGHSEKTMEWDRKTTSPGHAYKDMFERRLFRGQCYSIPFLGLKEFTPSYFGKFREQTKVNDLNSEIPSMLKQVFSDGFNSKVSYSFYQNIEIKNGVLEYPKEN
jgi:CRISPR-associated protein Cas5d